MQHEVEKGRIKKRDWKEWPVKEDNQESGIPEASEKEVSGKRE